MYFAGQTTAKKASADSGRKRARAAIRDYQFLNFGGPGRYGLAAVAFAISFLIRLGLNTWLTSDRGFILFLPAILLVTFFVGLGPAILTAVLSGVATWYFFLPPFYSFRLNLDGAVGLATFVLGSAVGISLVHWVRITINRAETERDRAEALARQRELLQEADPNGILVVDAGGRMRMANSQLARMFGYRREELIGQSVEILVPSRFRDDHVSLRAGFVANPSSRPMGARRDLYGLRKDGSEFPVEIGLSSFTTEDDANMSLAIVSDITERKRAEEAQKKFIRMLDSGFDAIMVLDAERRITGWNRGAEHLYGWTRDEVLGQVTHSLFQTQFPEPRDEIMSKTVQNGFWEGELVHTRKDGARITVFSRLTLNRDARGRQSFLETNMDITERKKAEETEQLLTVELQHRTKNLFAVVHALAHRSLRGSQTLDQAREVFLGRVQALMRADERVTSSVWQGASLSDIARSELEPFAGRFEVQGPEIELNSQAAQNFALAFHELATNAAKYGALLAAEGRVTIAWSVREKSGERALSLRWQERGGPSVSQPTAEGFGAALLRATLGESKIDYATDGLSYEIEVPLSQILPRGGTSTMIRLPSA